MGGGRGASVSELPQAWLLWTPLQKEPANFVSVSMALSAECVSCGGMATDTQISKDAQAQSWGRGH